MEISRLSSRNFWDMELHLVFSLLILFSNKNWSQGQDTCTVVNNINGCSTPLRLPFPYKSLFTPACNRHDVCYRCGVSHGWKQEECDKGFKQRMYTLCQNMTSSSSKNKRSTDESSWGKDFFVKMYNGWKKATENSTNTEQAKRLWNEALGIFKLVIKWRAIMIRWTNANTELIYIITRSKRLVFLPTAQRKNRIVKKPVQKQWETPTRNKICLILHQQLSWSGKHKIESNLVLRAFLRLWYHRCRRVLGRGWVERIITWNIC